MQVIRLNSFEKTLKRTLKKHDKCLNRVLSHCWDTLKLCESDDKCPGYFNRHVRKKRIGLSSYKIGKQKGLRLLYLVLDEVGALVPFFIFKKGDSTEHTLQSRAKKALEEALEEVTG